MSEELRSRYRAAMDSANDSYRLTGDLSRFQTMSRLAKDQWINAIHAKYYDADIVAQFRDTLAKSPRVYVDTVDGETVRVPSVAYLFAVSDVVGSPATPLIARLAGPFRASYTSIADIISQA